jgi:hypothetical protein
MRMWRPAEYFENRNSAISDPESQQRLDVANPRAAVTSHGTRKLVIL